MTVIRPKTAPDEVSITGERNQSPCSSPVRRSDFGPGVWRPAVLAILLILLEPLRPRAEDRVEFRYEGYFEQDNRMSVNTAGVWFQTDLDSKMVLQGEVVYDAISGATPSGGPPPPDVAEVPTIQFSDRRYAGNLGLDIRQGRLTHSPSVSYSYEHDYKSFGIAYNALVDFNQRNTTLALGFAHNFDEVSGIYQPDFASKGTSDVLIGLTQLLGPRTTLTVNATLGYNDGYLTDPYKGVNFYYAFPDPSFDALPYGVNSGEKRPSHRFRQVGYLGVNHYVKPLEGALETSFRLGHDDWGILSQTVDINWAQKLGRRVIVTPQFRFYHQSAADFYATRFTGDPLFPDGTPYSYDALDNVLLFPGDAGFPNGSVSEVPAFPDAYSSDYRLSQLNTYTFGGTLTVKVAEMATLTFTYKRYRMVGTDGVTLESAYPTANVYTAGFSLWF